MTRRRATAGAVVATALVLFVSAVAPAAPPTLTVEATDAVIGGAVHATASLTESPDAEGEINFEVFASATCAGPALDQSSVTVNGEGEYNSKNFKPTTAGNYYWTASYSGDEANEPAEAPCAATSTVAKASPEMTGNAASGVVGTAIHDEVTLSGGFSPGGEVTFSVYGPSDTNCETPLDTSTATVTDEEAISDDFIPQQTGEFRWSASYGGDANNEPFELDCEADGQSSNVAKASPGLSGTATSTVVVGNTITDQATLSGGFSPSGEIVFRAYGPGDASCGTSAYEATLPVSNNGPYSPAGFAPGPGVYRWTVEYKGDGNNEAAVLGCNASGQSSTVNKAAPGLSGSATSGVVGTAIHDEVTLTGGFSPGGEVTFSVYGPGDTTCATPLKTTAVPVASSKASSGDFISSQAGAFRWTASYGGDANNEAVSLGCNASGQTSTVAKASPGLSGAATSTVVVGNTITDQATLSGGFAPGGQLVFRAYGPDDATCAGTPAYETTVPVSSGNGPYSPAGFAPGPGVYLWTVGYEGDGNNETVGLGCNASGQASAVGTIDVTLTADATGGAVGTPVTATATIQKGATPGGQIVFKAFLPADANCSGAAAFSSTVGVAGNGSYRSAAFSPGRVGSFRWTVSYSGDANHAPATVGCGKAASGVVAAKPTVTGAVPQRMTVGTPFHDAATLQGGYSPGGSITFRIYGPIAAGCSGPAYVNTVPVDGNGSVSSAPFVALRTGRYSFTVSYSGDAENQAASEPCDSPSQVVQVVKRSPKVKPRGVLVGNQISIRARLSGSVSPAGAITFRLYGPDDKRCRRKPKFSGGITVKKNGSFSLARYLATKPGVYRLSVGYSGDPRNRRVNGACGSAQPIRVN